jgi:hypothetical protein
VVEEVKPPWIIGHIRFWARAQSIGNWDDYAALDGCAYWLGEFVTRAERRFEPDLLGKSKDEVFHILYDSFMGRLTGREPYVDTYGRFNISRLGMSSFDKYVVLLIEEPQQQRLVWQSSDDYVVKEALLPSGEMQRVAHAFCVALQTDGSVAPHDPTGTRE